MQCKTFIKKSKTIFPPDYPRNVKLYFVSDFSLSSNFKPKNKISKQIPR